MGTRNNQKTAENQEAQYDRIMEKLLAIAWDAAPMAMKAIAEAAQDGDIAASYYIVNRTLGRPTEAPKAEKTDDYSDLLRNLRSVRAGGTEGGSAADPGRTSAPLEAGRVHPSPEAVGSPHESGETETDSRGGTRG